MDIEGNEWHILQKIDESNLSKISQMVIEFHLIHIDINKKVLSEKYTPYFTKFYKNNYSSINRDLFQKYFEIIKKLNKYFYIFHIHPNNSIKKINIENFSIPPLLEISFINRKCVRSVRISESKFPIRILIFQIKLIGVILKIFIHLLKMKKNINKISNKIKVLVIGDLMLDEYLHGNVEEFLPKHQCQ